MLQFNQDDTSVEIVLTLTESVTISDPYYLFVFTHVLTKNVVKWVQSPGSDQSTAQTRYNQFAVNPSVKFADQPIGEWHYKVYEQASSSNTDEDSTGTLLERGKLRLLRSADFSFTKYNPATSYTAYNG